MNIKNLNKPNPEILSLIKHRQKYSDLSYQFINERKAYIKAELAEIGRKYGLIYGDSILALSNADVFLLADMNTQVVCNVESTLDCSTFRLFGYMISKSGRVNKRCKPIPTCFTYPNYTGSTGKECFNDYELAIYGMASNLRKFNHIDDLKYLL